MCILSTNFDAIYDPTNRPIKDEIATPPAKKVVVAKKVTVTKKAAVVALPATATSPAKKVVVETKKIKVKEVVKKVKK